MIGGEDQYLRRDVHAVSHPEATPTVQGDGMVDDARLTDGDAAPYGHGHPSLDDGPRSDRPQAQVAENPDAEGVTWKPEEGVDDYQEEVHDRCLGTSGKQA